MERTMRAVCLATLIAGLSLDAAVPTAQASEQYTNAGLMIDHVLPLTSRFSPRGELITLDNNGGSTTYGGRSFATWASDRPDVSVSFPGITPYLGLGYGIQGLSGSSFRFELGSSIGRPGVSEPQSGPTVGGAPPAEFDREQAQLREGMGRMRSVPQISLGMKLRF
jgi:hypothetical protein